MWFDILHYILASSTPWPTSDQPEQSANGIQSSMTAIKQAQSRMTCWIWNFNKQTKKKQKPNDRDLLQVNYFTYTQPNISISVLARGGNYGCRHTAACQINFSTFIYRMCERWTQHLPCLFDLCVLCTIHLFDSRTVIKYDFDVFAHDGHFSTNHSQMVDLMLLWFRGSSGCDSTDHTCEPKWQNIRRNVKHN